MEIWLRKPVDLSISVIVNGSDWQLGFLLDGVELGRRYRVAEFDVMCREDVLLAEFDLELILHSRHFLGIAARSI